MNAPKRLAGPPLVLFVSWSDEEWDRLAQMVWRARKNEPAETIIGLTKKVMTQFSAERRRNIRVVNEIKPLIERLTAIDEKYLGFERQLSEAMAKVAELEQLKEQLESCLRNTPTKESVVSGLTDEEIGVYFADKVLDLLTPDDVLKRFQPETLLSYVPFPDMIGHVLKSGVDLLTERQNTLTTAVLELTALVRHQQQKTTHHKPSMPTPRVVASGRLWRVAVVGLLPDQARIVEEKFKGRAQFNFVDKNRMSGDSIPLNQEVLVLMANFIKHTTYDQAKKRVAGTNTKLITHHGGIDMLCRKLDEVLPQLEFAQ